MKNKLLIILTFLTIGCTKETGQPIEIRHFFRQGELKETIKANLVTVVTKDSIYYSYRSDSTSAFIFKINRNDKSGLTYFNFNTPIVDKKVFTTNGQATEILRYNYDEPTMFDEEESIFFIDNYGVIAIKSNSWSYFIQFDKGGQLETELFKLLLQDTSGFYGYRPPPKINIE